MHQYRTLDYRSTQGGVFEGSIGQAKYMQIGLPLAAHGNPTGIHYTGERNIVSLGGSGIGKSMDVFGRGSFSGFKVEATLEGEKLQISSRKKEKRITRAFATVSVQL